MPNKAQLQRTINVKFCQGDAIHISTCTLELTLPNKMESKEAFAAAFKAAVGNDDGNFNTW